MNKERLIEKLSEANVRAVARLITLIENENPLSEEILKKVWKETGKRDSSLITKLENVENKFYDEIDDRLIK